MKQDGQNDDRLIEWWSSSPFFGALGCEECGHIKKKVKAHPSSILDQARSWKKRCKKAVEFKCKTGKLLAT